MLLEPSDLAPLKVLARLAGALVVVVGLSSAAVTGLALVF